MKKRIFVLLLSFFLLMCAAPQVLGAPAAKVTWNDVTVQQGDSFEIVLNASDMAPAKSVYVGVSYDPAVLELIGGEWLLPEPDVADWDNELKDGVIAYLNPITVQGGFFKFKFRAIGTPSTGECELNVTCRMKIEETFLSFDLVPGKIRFGHEHQYTGWTWSSATEHTATCSVCGSTVRQPHESKDVGYDGVVKAYKQICTVCGGTLYYRLAGDVDGDGQIAAADARLALRAAVRLEVFSPLDTAVAEDVDVLVTGDKDFDDVTLERPDILTPSEFIERFA